MARMRPSLGMRQSARQEMQLLPRMLQSVEVLQLPATELESYLVQAAEENEALSLDVPREPPGALSGGASAGREATDRHDAWLESQAAREGGLVEHLAEQLALVDVDAALRPWVDLVVENLDPGGLLSVGDEALAAAATERGLDAADGALGRAIAFVQRLEPRGVGGRDAVEALLLQLDADDPDYELLCRLLEEFLEDVARNKLPAVARSLGVDLERLAELLARLKELRPVPGATLAGESPPPVRPEVLVERVGDGFEVKVDQSGLPSVSVDDDVRALARDRRQSEDVKRYLRGKLDQARWLVEAIEQRRETLLRVSQAAFHHQRAFLEMGPGNLRPLRMSALAEQLDLHVSTVSRAVAGKYADTPFGIVPLRHLFQAEGGGETGSARSDVCAQVGEIVAAEDATAPLSDEDIAAELARRGFEVARRTVAKYRRELGIKSSYQRRRYE